MLSTQKDHPLTKIPNLIRLPWVGSQFSNAKRRLLIVGESHYTMGKTKTEHEEDLLRHKNPDFTRKLIEETQIQNLYRYLLLDNFWQALFQKQPNKSELWKHISFYNFIQRSMDYSSFESERREQPNRADFKNGWPVFAEVVKILKPTDCIFLGLKASEGFGNLKADKTVTQFDYSYSPKIGNMTPVEGSFTIDGQKTIVSFIQHCSSFFSPQSWNPFLQKRHPEIIDFLMKKSF